MLPYQRKKVDISVCFTLTCTGHTTEFRSETDSPGATALLKVRQTSYAQEYPNEDAEGAFSGVF
jgi:hypothetical protein